MSIDAFSLKGKTILVTGGSSGIGKGIAEAAATFGASVVVSGRSESKLRAVAASLSGEAAHSIIVADLSDASQVEALVEACPPLDGLVLSAGVMQFYTLRQASEDKVDEMISINLNAQIKFFRRLVLAKKIKRHASVVTLSSIAGTSFVGRANFVYAATKAGLRAFTRGIAVDLSSKRIRANCIAPGMIDTLGIGSLHDTISAEAIAADKAKYLLGDWGSVEDVAYGAIYLLSDASKYVTGTTLIIDGGRSVYTIENSRA